MVSIGRWAAGVAAMLVVIAILGYYLSSTGTESHAVSTSSPISSSATQTSTTTQAGPTTTTVALNCPKDGDSDHEQLTTTTTTFGSSTTTIAIGTCVVDTDGDGY